MKFTHTPAPWKVVSGSVYSNDDIPIAHMERDANKARGIPPVERDRNAHLIAAAPELLEALKNLLAHSENVNAAFYGTGTRKAMIAAMDGQKELLQAARSAAKNAYK